MTIRSYRDLDVWQKAMKLVVACYRAAEGSPKSETYGLTIQLQPAAVSVPANIAEGQGRNHTREFINHLSIAYGSLMEVETHLQIAHDLGYIEQTVPDDLLVASNKIGRMADAGAHSKLNTDH